MAGVAAVRRRLCAPAAAGGLGARAGRDFARARGHLVPARDRGPRASGDARGGHARWRDPQSGAHQCLSPGRVDRDLLVDAAGARPTVGCLEPWLELGKRVQQLPWQRSHNLRGGGGAMPWPDLTLVPEGAVTHVVWTAVSGLPAQPVSFLTSGDTYLPAYAVRQALGHLVEQVLERLTEAGVTGTVLQREWEELGELDEDERQFAAAAARLGLDPFDVDDQVADQIESRVWPTRTIRNCWASSWTALTCSTSAWQGDGWSAPAGTPGSRPAPERRCRSIPEPTRLNRGHSGTSSPAPTGRSSGSGRSTG